MKKRMWVWHGRTYKYVGYCRVCQQSRFFEYKRLLSLREISRWRKCYECGEYGIYGLSRCN